MTLTLYSTTTCGPCKIVAKRFTDAKVPFKEIKLDLDEHATTLATLKRTLNADQIGTPLVIDDGDVVMRGPGIDPAKLDGLIEKHRRDAA